MLGIRYGIRSKLRIGHDEVPCPTTFKREAINDTLPAKVPKGAIGVLSTIDKHAANESSMCGTRESPNLYRAVNYCPKWEFGMKFKEKTCERCGREVQSMNDFFLRCPYCAVLKKKEMLS